MSRSPSPVGRQGAHRSPAPPATWRPPRSVRLLEAPLPHRSCVEPFQALVVEDEPALASVAVRALDLCGIRVGAARDLTGALELLASGRGEVGVVVLDAALPGTTPAAAAEILAAGAPGVPIVLLTDDAELAAAVDGVAGRVRKPFSADALVAEVRRVRHGRCATDV